MAANQVVARDIGLLIKDLRALSEKSGLDPMVTAMLTLMIRFAEILRRYSKSA